MEIEIAKMTSKGQVVIPQEIREETGVEEGERFFVYSKDDEIILKRIKKLQKVKDVQKFEKVFKSMWKTAEERGITKEDVEREIGAVRMKNAS